ncbi:sporulation protein [Brevibacillus laterosporus]|uniref:Sporulation protein n=1 Tax=Brevibacillus laterosporus TaxID=1465 RepID=A0AAP3DDB3_BRELA|nr:sporulation protein [Brevibacillus laterosporus]MCR8978777.1 sporulation protein [Brevibacillus laterosporus]MCZ0805933.1 sporulation protein [Brevibacillus laterosporus]MCZ0824320.1 sporulation protein [Brevibacillus laterosporus]MCZ0848227.1 sporulation protein [Brevibacillus laterosporus]
MSGQPSNRISIKLSPTIPLKNKTGANKPVENIQVKVQHDHKKEQAEKAMGNEGIHGGIRELEGDDNKETRQEIDEQQVKEAELELAEAMRRLGKLEEQNPPTHTSKEQFLAELYRDEGSLKKDEKVRAIVEDRLENEGYQASYYEGLYSSDWLQQSKNPAWWDKLIKNQGHMSKRPVLRVFITTISAIILGVLFGFIVLNIFVQEQLVHPSQAGATLPKSNELHPSSVSPESKNVLSEKSIPVHGGNQANGSNHVQEAGLPKEGTSQQATSATGSASQKIEDAVLASVQFPEQNYYMVQMGVFTDQKAAEPAIASLDEKGLPHFLYQIDGRLHLFTGVAPSRDAILGLADNFRQRQIDVYVKEVKLPAMEKQVQIVPASALEVGASADKGVVNAFIRSGADIIQQLSALSSQVVNTDKQKVQPLTAEQESKLKSMHVAFLDNSRATQRALSQKEQVYVAGMVQGMNQAMSTMTQLKTVNAEPYAWQVQKGIMQYLHYYAKWMKENN